MPIETALYGMHQADKAADAQVGAANNATATQWKMYNQTRKDQMPWMQAGQGGLNALMGLYNMQRSPDGSWSMNSDPNAYKKFLQLDPGYQFRLQQGQDALQNSAAAKGGLLSGNALRALTQYGQDYASNEFGNLANRYSGLAGVGQSAGQYLGNIGANTATNVGNNMMTAGAARASGYMGQYNAVSNGLDQIMKIGGMAAGYGG